MSLFCASQFAWTQLQFGKCSLGRVAALFPGSQIPGCWWEAQGHPNLCTVPRRILGGGHFLSRKEEDPAFVPGVLKSQVVPYPGSTSLPQALSERVETVFIPSLCKVSLFTLLFWAFLVHIVFVFFYLLPSFFFSFLKF